MEHYLTSLMALFEWQNFLLMVLGTFIGVVVGVLPGIGATHAMAIVIPLTWKMETMPALVLLMAIYATSKFGGSLTAILFNIPGDTPNAVTLIDGYPMAQNGEAKKAIGASATVSIMGGLFSALSLLVFLPVMYQLILLFGPAEFCMLALFGLTAISAVSGKSLMKGLASGGLGILISTIGFHPLLGETRYTFGIMYLEDGINMVPVILGALAMSEALILWMKGSSIVSESVPLRGSYRDGFVAVFRNKVLFVKSCFIAWVVGVAPGAGATASGFICYASAVKTCKNPEKFGKGDVRGLIAADTGLHACGGGDLLPTITMGIPGSNAMAILLGAFLLHGITPGPQIVKMHLDLVYLIIYVLFFAHVIGVFVAVGFSNFMEKLTKTRAEIISPIIIALCLLGSYVMREYWQDVMVTTLFSIVGYYMRKHGYHPVPLLLGIILGPIAEFGYYQAISISVNGPLIFITRIPSLIILLCTLLVVFWPYVGNTYRRIRMKAAS